MKIKKIKEKANYDRVLKAGMRLLYSLCVCLLAEKKKISVLLASCLEAILQLGVRHPCQEKLGSCPPPQEMGDRGAIFLDDYLSKGWLPSPWERYSWVVKQAKAV